MSNAYDSKKLDVMTVTPGVITVGQDAGRIKWSTSVEAHAKAVIDQLGR